VKKLLGVLGKAGAAAAASASVAAPLSPDAVTGLALWLKADSLSLNDTDPVSTWTDSSSNGLNATQTSTKRPLYRTNQKHGLPGVVFDGTDDCLVTAAMNLTGTSAITVFAVFSAASTGDQVVVEMSADYNAQTDSFILYRETGNKVQADCRGNTGDNVDKSANSLTTVPRLATAIYDKAASLIPTEEASVWVGGVPWGWLGYSVVGDTRGTAFNNTNAFGNRVLNIGARNNGASLPLNGALYELIVYNTLLSGANLAGIEWYLNDKWELS
jgi:hypothetical protein